MSSDQQFCLRWNNHQNTLVSIFDSLLESGTLVDCTLAADGRFLHAHKVVLSACSPYFAMLLKEHCDKFPILILKDIKYHELQAMMNYMYRGEVNITQDQLGSFLKAAESLQIRGLTDSGVDNNANRDIPIHVNKKVPESRRISSTMNSRSPPIMVPHVKKYLKPPLENHFSSRSSIELENVTPVPSAKRRKLVPPIKSEGLVVTPINPPTPYAASRPSSTTSSADCCDIMMPQSQSFVASESRSGVPSPSIPSSSDSPQRRVESPAQAVIVKSDKRATPMSEQLQLHMQQQQEHHQSLMKIKTEKPEDFYNNNEEDDTNDGSYVTDENIENESRDENHLSTSFQNSQSFGSSNYDNLSDRSVGQDSNSGIQDSQVLEETYYEFFENNFNTRTGIADVRMFRCSQCSKTYRYKCTLQRHITYECGKQPNFHCPYCPVSMKRKSNLMSHIAAKHSALLT